MKKPSETQDNRIERRQDSWADRREEIMGLGEHSLRKTYYPELQLRLDELERFRSLLDQSNDCIFLLKIPSLIFVDVNESACRQLGCRREDLLALPLVNFVPEDVIARIGELSATGIAEGKDRDTITTELQKCSGGEMPVEIAIRLVTFNKVQYGVAVARDITERKRAEQALMENFRMLRDMELARQIQLSLLPTTPPELPGILLAGCCVPATHVGGDYYDFFKNDYGEVNLVVADVSGHSFGAALMTAEARSVLRTQIHRYNGTGEVLASLNRNLHDDLDHAGLFITLIYVKYDALNRILYYSNAGHVPPLLYRASEATCRKLEAEGLIIGVRKGEIYEAKQLQLQAGDVLLLYTDGITEAMNAAGEEFGVDRLSRSFAARHTEAPQSIILGIIKEVAEFTGTSVMEDDVTMIVMKVI
jgi:PAS domain S-box-containing protein